MDWKGKDWKLIAQASVLVLALLVSLFTGWRVSDVVESLDQTLDSPAIELLPEDIQAQIDGLQKEWDELASLVTDIEDLVVVFGQIEEQGVTNFDSLTLSDDLIVGDDLTVTDDALVSGDMTVSGTASWGCSDTTIGGDLTITGTMTAEDGVITDTLDINGDIDLDGDGFDVNITAGFSVDADAASNINVAGAGIDLTVESEAGRLVLKGDEAAANAIHLDANDAVTTGIDIDVGSISGLTIDGGLVDIGGGTGGTADGDNDLLVAADLEVDNTLDVDGDIDLDGDGFDVNITAGWSIVGDLVSYLTTAAGDIVLEAQTGSIVLKGDEAVADAIYLDANDAVTTGVTIAVGSVSGLNIGGGLTDVGGGTYATADGDNDLGVAADLEVDNTLDVDGDIDLDGDGFDVNITAGWSIVGDLVSYLTTAVGDIVLEAETGSIVLKGDEAVADAIYLDANDTVTTGVTIAVGSVSGLAVTGGPVDIASTLQYGASDLYPVGFATSGQQAVYGSSLVTGTLAAPHGLTTVTFCVATLGEDPETGAGDGAFVTVAVSGNVCTLKVWQDDWTTAATEVDVIVQWLVIGAP